MQAANHRLTNADRFTFLAMSELDAPIAHHLDNFIPVRNRQRFMARQMLSSDGLNDRSRPHPGWILRIQ